MELNKTLMLSTLFSALVLTGCGGGGGGGGTDDTGADNSGEGPANPDSTNPDPVDPNFGFVDAYSTKISGDIQAAVKAATFFKYEEDVANYELAFDYVADYSSQLGDLLAENAGYLVFYKSTLADPGKTVEGDCTEAGALFAKGYVPGLFSENQVTDINFNATAYCSQLKDGENLTGDELTLSGGAHLIVDEPGYSLELDEIVIKYDALDTDIADVIVAIDGAIEYSEADSSQQLAVNAEVTFDGIAGNYNFTQTCIDSDCLIDAEIIPGNGYEYTVDGLTVTLDNGYQGSADIFYNAVLGELAVSFDQIQYCEDGSIGSGTMNIIEKDGTAEIATSFNGCGEDPIVEFYADGAP